MPFVEGPIQTSIPYATSLAYANGWSLSELPGLYVGPKPKRDARYFGIVDSTSIDQTTALQQACTDAGELGVDLVFTGVVIRTGQITSPVSWYGRGWDMTEHRMNGASGVGGRISFTGNNKTVQDISFTSPLTPASALNNAVEADGALAFADVTDVIVRRNKFTNLFGGGVIFRNVVNGLMQANRIEGSFKDGLHVNGASYNITREHNVLILCGDDALACVSYMTGGTTGRVTNIVDRFNYIHGARFARGISYVGSRDVQCYGNFITGTVPSGFPTTAPGGNRFRLLSGLYIAAEASFDTWGNLNLHAHNNVVRNCGFTSDFTGAAYSAVHIGGRAGGAGTESKNIRVDVDVQDVGTRGIFVNGAGGLSDLQLTGRIANTNDPSGWFGTAGTGTASGFEIQNTNNAVLALLLDSTGGYGGIITSNNTGKFDVKLRTMDINTSGSAGVDILNCGSGSSIADFNIEVDIIKQATVTAANTPYRLDRIVECNNPGKIRSLRVNDFVNLVKSNVTGVAAQTIAATISPFSWTNPHPIPVNVRVTGGTVSAIERAQTTGVSSPVFGTIPGKTQGYITLAPGETIRVTYSSAPTMAYDPGSC